MRGQGLSSQALCRSTYSVLYTSFPNGDQDYAKPQPYAGA